MAKYALVTCISRPDVYQQCVLDSIARCRNGHDIEIVPVYNISGQFSASSALNYGMSVTDADYVICLHQDVSLLGNWFHDLDVMIEKLDNWAILGASGINLDVHRQHIGGWGGPIDDSIKTAVGVVYTGEIGALEPHWNGIEVPTKVHCVDESLLVINRKANVHFSPMDGFHLYGADISLQARAAGYDVYVGSLPIIHHIQYSTSMNNSYWGILRHLYYTWYTKFPEVLGTYFHWSTSNGIPEITGYAGPKLRTDDYMIDVKYMKIGRTHFD